MKIDINELRRLALDGDLAAMQEIILCLKAVEKERDALHAALQHEADCVEACKSEIERLRAENVGLVDDMNLLRTKIAEMERQEPIGTTEGMPGTTGFTMACFHADKVPIGSKLYTLPGAKGE